MVQRRSCKNSETTEIHWNTHIYTLYSAMNVSGLVGMNSLPSIRVNTRQSERTPPRAICNPKKKKGFWVTIKTEKSRVRKTKAAFSHSLMCKYMHSLVFYPPTCPVVRSAQVPQTSCVSAPLIPFTSCLSHPETKGLGGPASAKVCPAPKTSRLVSYNQLG